MSLGPMEIILLVAVTVLLFGGKKFPQLMKGIGEGLKEFKKARMDEPDAVKKPAELKPPE
jgi:sec-independent protein translocase protein TatA